MGDSIGGSESAALQKNMEHALNPCPICGLKHRLMGDICNIAGVVVVVNADAVRGFF
jgi:hypothetical protein